MIDASGNPVTVYVDKDFGVVSVETGGPGRPRRLAAEPDRVTTELEPAVWRETTGSTLFDVRNGCSAARSASPRRVARSRRRRAGSARPSSSRPEPTSRSARAGRRRRARPTLDGSRGAVRDRGEELVQPRALAARVLARVEQVAARAASGRGARTRPAARRSRGRGGRRARAARPTGPATSGNAERMSSRVGRAL